MQKKNADKTFFMNTVNFLFLKKEFNVEKNLKFCN